MTSLESCQPKLKLELRTTTAIEFTVGCLKPLQFGPVNALEYLPAFYSPEAAPTQLI